MVRAFCVCTLLISSLSLCAQEKNAPHPRLLQSKVALDAYGLKLLEVKTVREYLHLTKEDEVWINYAYQHYHKQIRDISDLQQKAGQNDSVLVRVQKMTSNAHDGLLRDISTMMNVEQLVSLYQIRMQLSGHAIAFTPELSGILKITPEQHGAYKAAMHTYETELERPLKANANTLTTEQKQTLITVAHEKQYPILQSSITAILTPTQVEWFNALKGKTLPMEKEKFNSEIVLLKIEQRLIPRAIPRIIEPFPLAEIALIKQVLNWAKVSAEHQPQVQRLATNWIEAELSFYIQLETTSEAQREDVLKKWYFKRVQDHSQFTDEIRKLCGEDVVHRLNQAQMQLRGFTILAEKSLREKLGISDDQFRAMMATLSVPAANPPKADPKAPKLAYGRISSEMEQKMMEVLAPEQIKRWRDLVGDPIAPDDLKAIAEQIMQTQSSRLPESAFFDPNRNKAK